MSNVVIKPVQQNWGNTELSVVRREFARNEILPEIAWTTVLSLRFDDPGEIISVTLTLPPAEGVANNIFRTHALALIEWGSGGSLYKTIVDYIAGTTFSIPASFLRVSAAHFDFTAENSANTSRFGAIAALGAVSNGIAPQRTMYPIDNNIAAGASSDVLIPPFAKCFSILALNNANDGSPALTLRQQRNDPIILVTHSAQVYGANVPIVNVPISGFARKINVQNDDALPTSVVAFVFNLSL